LILSRQRRIVLGLEQILAGPRLPINGQHHSEPMRLQRPMGEFALLFAGILGALAGMLFVE
jgi:hypothetical protein